MGTSINVRFELGFYHAREMESIKGNIKGNIVSRQNEKFLIGQSRKFLLTAVRLEKWNGSR